MSITIREIVRKSGYGLGTVSRALGASGASIKQETRQKITAIAKKYGYIKNVNAIALSVGRSRDIGLFVPAMFVSPFYNDFYFKLIAGVTEAADTFGYNVRLVLLKDKNVFSEIVREIGSFRLHGTILGPDYWGEVFINRNSIRDLEIPVVLLDYPVQGKNIRSIMLDDIRGGYDGTEYLIGLGHKRIAIYRGYPKDMEDRFTGYKKALKAHGLKMNPEYIIRGVPNEEVAGHENTLRILKVKPRPTAIFCLGDELAFSTMRALKENGLRCPDDISVLGYDGIETGGFTEPPLSTMNRPVRVMAQTAVELLMDKKRWSEKKSHMIRAELTVRKSCRNIR